MDELKCQLDSIFAKRMRNKKTWRKIKWAEAASVDHANGNHHKPRYATLNYPLIFCALN